MRAIILAFCILFTSFSYAAADSLTIDPSTLKGDDFQKIQKILDDSKSAKDIVTGSLNDPKKLNEWVDLGKNLGTALSSAAKELGTGATEFAKTPVGTMVTFIILWKLFANDLMLVFLTLSTFFIGNYVLIRIARSRSIEVTREGSWFRPTKVERKVVPAADRATDLEMWLFAILVVVNNGLGIIAVFNIG